MQVACKKGRNTITLKAFLQAQSMLCTEQPSITAPLSFAQFSSQVSKDGSDSHVRGGDQGGKKQLLCMCLSMKKTDSSYTKILNRVLVFEGFSAKIYSTQTPQSPISTCWGNCTVLAMGSGAPPSHIISNDLCLKKQHCTSYSFSHEAAILRMTKFLKQLLLNC